MGPQNWRHGNWPNTLRDGHHADSSDTTESATAMKMVFRRTYLWILLAIALSVAIALGLKLYEHEKWQSGQIHDLSAQVQELQKTNESLSAQISAMQEQIDSLQRRVEYSDTAFNYLAIGNSITIHGLADYWWNEAGMAASVAENDYVHLVADYLEETHGEVCFYSANYYEWEQQAHDRAETYDAIAPYLSAKLDLITVQLGENVIDATTFESDFAALLTYLSRHAPNAEILVIDDFWDEGEREGVKERAADAAGVRFVSLDEIQGDQEYQCGVGATVFDAEGQPHVVEHAGVAIHPGDKGMRYIADRIIDALKSE